MAALYYSTKWAKRADYQHMLSVVGGVVSDGSISLGSGMYVPAQYEYLGKSYLDGRYISKKHLIYLYNNDVPDWRKRVY